MKIVVEFTQRFTVIPPADIDDEVHAGQWFWNIYPEIVRNDIDEQRDADLHLDVCEIADHLEPESFDTVVYDPPFSDYQAHRSYDGQQVGNDALAKQQFDALLRPGGRVIQFGYTTTCMPNELGYRRKTAWIWNTLGRMNDYLSVVDEKPGESQTSPRWFRPQGTATEHPGGRSS